jgi:hypothetical protein
MTRQIRSSLLISVATLTFITVGNGVPSRANAMDLGGIGMLMGGGAGMPMMRSMPMMHGGGPGMPMMMHGDGAGMSMMHSVVPMLIEGAAAAAAAHATNPAINQVSREPVGGRSAVGSSNGHRNHPEGKGKKGSTISVDDGHGGWKPYEPKPKDPPTSPPPPPPAGHAGISVDDGHGGWKPYEPKPKDPPTLPPPPPPAGHAGISVDDGHGGWKPYEPKPKDPVVGSSTDNGVTTTVTTNGAGGHVVTTTDADGKTSVRETGGERDRDIGGGMREHFGTGGVPSWIILYDPESGQTVKRVFNGDGTFVDTATVSYGSSAQSGLVRVDDLPKVKKQVKDNCALLRAKVNKLTADLAREMAVMSTLKGAENVNLPGTTVTGTATSFSPAGDPQFAIDRLQSDINDTQELLARYTADLDRCEKNNAGN